MTKDVPATTKQRRSPDGLCHNLRVQVIRELLVQRGFHREGLVDEAYDRPWRASLNNGRPSKQR